MRRRRPTDAAILTAIAELVDDGFCPRHSLGARFPGVGQRDLVKSVQRVARHGLILERRGPDARIYLSLTGEGWNSLRAADPSG